MSEATRYLKNAKEVLSQSPIEDNTYADIKYVQEACSTAYLAVLKALDAYFMRYGVDKDDLPQSIEGYRTLMNKHLSVHNGKLSKRFDTIYRALHVAGYYRGLLDDVAMVKEAFKSAKDFIEKVEAA